MIKKVHPGYLARNKDVAIVYGLNAGLCKIEERMKSRKDCPAWLLVALEDMIHRSNDLIRPLVEFRNQLKGGDQDNERNATHGQPISMGDLRRAMEIYGKYGED